MKMDSSDSDDESEAKLPQTPRKLETEQAGGSQNTYSLRAGQYGCFAVIDRQRSPSPQQAPAPAAAVAAAVAAAAPSILNVDHEMIDLVTPPSSQVNNFTPLTQQSTTDSWKKDMFSDDDDNFNGETFIPPTERSAPPTVLGNLSPESTTDSFKQDMFSDDDNNLLGTINLPSTSSAPQVNERKRLILSSPSSSSSSSSSSSVIQKTKKRCLEISSSSSSSSTSTSSSVKETSKKKCLPLSSLSSSSSHNNDLESLSQSQSYRSTTDTSDNSTVCDDDDEQTTLRESSDADTNNDNDMDLEDAPDRENLVVDNVDDNTNNDNNMDYYLEEAPDTVQLSQLSIASWVSEASSPETFDKKLMEKQQQNLQALENNTPTSPQLPPQQPTIATPSPPPPPQQPTIATPPPPPPQQPTTQTFKRPSTSTVRSRSPSLSSSCASSYRTNMSAGTKKFQSIDKENREEYTVQFSFKKFCGIDSQTNDNDNKLKIYNKIINDVRIISEWAKESSIFFEFAINHPNSWLVNWISSKDEFHHINIIFNILRSDWKPKKATKDSEEFKELNKLFDEYKKERPQNIQLGPTYNTSNLSNLVEGQCVTYFTNFKNNLLNHFYKRLRKLLKNQKTQFFNEKGKEISIYKVLKNLFTKDILPDVEIFKRDEFKNLKFSKFQQNWWKFLKFYLELQKQMKSFVLIPVLKCGLRHVKYSTTALQQFALTLEKETEKETEKQTGKKTKQKTTQHTIKSRTHESLWKQYFTIKNDSRLDRDFYLSMTTDGVSVSLFCMRKKKLINNSISIDKNIDNYNRLFFGDIGLRLLFGGVILNSINQLGNKELEQRYTYKSKTHRYRSGEFKRQEKRKKITAEVDKYVENLLLTDEFKNINTKDPTNYKNIMKFRVLCFDKLHPVYSQLRVMRIKWDKKIKVKKSIDDMANFIGYGVNPKNRKKKKKETTNEKNKKKVKVKNKDNSTRSREKRIRKHKLQVNKARENKEKRTDDEKERAKASRLKEQARRKQLRLAISKRLTEKKKEQLKKQLEKKSVKKLRRINVDQHKTLVIVGNVNVAKHMSGYVPAPTSKFIKKVEKLKNVKVLYVDEYNTTKLCSECSTNLIVGKYGHRYCYCPKCHTTWNRDVNAGRNIGKLGLIRENFVDENYFKNEKGWNFKKFSRKKYTDDDDEEDEDEDDDDNDDSEEEEQQQQQQQQL